MKRQGILVKVEDTWYPVGQVAEKLAEEEQYKVLLEVDELAMAGILRTLGFEVSIEVPGAGEN